MRLARVGHDFVSGFILAGDFSGEKRSVEQVSVRDADEALRKYNDVQFVDVRRTAEHANGHAPNTINIPLDKLSNEFETLDPALPTYVICQGGYRSSIGTSILENAGFNKLYNVTGGTAAWIEAGLETETSATACATN
jgi:rhodanese-related sulfurtransferase